MIRISWLADVHLEMVRETHLRRALYDKIASTHPDFVVISGDIATAPTIAPTLVEIRHAIPCPVLFVLGNHDFYRGSFAQVREAVHRVTQETEGLRYLSQDNGVVSVSANTAVIGHDGWADGRYGDYARSTVMLNDYVHNASHRPGE